MKIDKLEPPFWWTDMVHDTISVLVYGSDLTHCFVQTIDPCVEIIQQKAFPNPNYFSLRMKINAPGTADISFTDKSSPTKQIVHYEIKERSGYTAPEINASDVVYLLMPDRFADGNSDNNTIPDNTDNYRPDHKWGRRGGDIAGIIKHFSYLADLKITTLWLTPIYENNYPNAYHGYTPTDLYKLDPHIGTTEEYRELIALLHSHRMKIIQDHIVNHISPTHLLSQSPPNPNWINGSLKDHFPCDYQIENVTCAHGITALRLHTQAGWFAAYLTDMNMAEPAVTEYFIQQTIWWIEEFHLDGIRQDTFPYSDQSGLKTWALELRREYDSLFLVGETMTDNPITLSYFFSDSPRLENSLSSVTDFPLAKSIKDLQAGKMSLKSFYMQICQDFIYKSSNNLLVFLDNHDMGRYASEVDPQSTDYINAFTFLYGLRGIPMVYYGDEFGMPGGHDPDNRRMMSGNTNDNVFDQGTRTDEQNQLIQQFIEWNKLRQNHPELFTSDMKHHLLHDHLYIAIRQVGDNFLFTIFNQSPEEEVLDLSPYLNAPVQWSVQISPLTPRLKFYKKNALITVPPGLVTMWFIEIQEINR